eukprot:scaffold17710_cov92-Phaeocystis_antarctica.AAC.4
MSFSLPRATADASAPDADATAHSTPAAGPRISTLSTANGRRVSWLPFLAVERSQGSSDTCSAPSRSAG